MYATFGLPGSQHFDYHGPASEAECEIWLAQKRREHNNQNPVAIGQPEEIITNKAASMMRWSRSGERIIAAAE